MENLSKATPVLAIAALVCAIAGLVLGILAFKKSSQVDGVTELKDANSTISGSVAALQDEISGLSKKYATVANLKEVAAQTQEGFNQITDSLAKVRTQSRADTIKIAEIESRLQGGARVTASMPSPTTTPTTGSTPAADNAEASSPSSNVPTGGTEYTIQSGDTLAKVAKDFGISLSKLMEANPGVQPKYLRVGQAIFIPE